MSNRLPRRIEHEVKTVIGQRRVRTVAEARGNVH